MAGFQPGRENSEIVFTADVLDRATLAKVTELDIPVNAGSIDMLEQIGEQKLAILFGCVSTLVLVTVIAKN